MRKKVTITLTSLLALFGLQQPLSAFPVISGPVALRRIEAQVAFGPRVPGTKAHSQARDYFVAALKRQTPHVSVESFEVESDGRRIPMANVVAVFRPGHGNPAMVAAHWDSRPRSEQDPHPEHRSLPTPGAEDGASGVAVVLEMAKALHDDPPPREVRLVLFDGEDWGTTVESMFFGSSDYVRRHAKDLPAWGILLDMVSNPRLSIPREGFSSRRAKALTDRIYQTANAMGYGHAFPDREGPEIFDDHLPFLDQGIPVVDLIDFNYPYWHTVHDLPSECSASSLEVVGNVVLKVLMAPRMNL